MTVTHFSSADFVEQFSNSKNEREKALILAHVFEGLREDQKMQVKYEINSKELATKGDVAFIRQELTHYATKKELVETVSAAKWQVIGAVAAMLFVEVALRHFGF